MKDRLSDLQQSATKEISLSALVERLDEEWTDPSEKTNLLNKASSSKVVAFLTHVDRLVNDMNGMETLLDEIKDWHWKIIVEPGDHPEMNAQLDEAVVSYTTMLYKTEAALKCLNSEVERLFEKPTDENTQTVEARIRRNQIMTLTKRLQGLLIAFNDEQLTYKDKCKRKIQSYLKISDNAVNEEDLEAIIEKGTLFEHTKVLMLAERDKKALYDEVKTRHKDIVKLEGSIKELHGLFVELATLIQSQSEMLNNIERNVEHAVEYAQKAHTNMVKAKNMRANVRKLQCLFHRQLKLHLLH
ncbi:SNARE domain protein [Onchocerca flexuosa]|uniref:SNARE domain protein n=1 Tax=Onchocerca flexuosa TaxID=387005 RepID=A0A238C1B2_9BILA|nr:SNARE domain protein [Onchocerca flexuosa]